MLPVLAQAKDWIWPRLPPTNGFPALDQGKGRIPLGKKAGGKKGFFPKVKPGVNFQARPRGRGLTPGPLSKG